jgi:hypothetical protein
LRKQSSDVANKDRWIFVTSPYKPRIACRKDRALLFFSVAKKLMGVAMGEI